MLSYLVDFVQNSSSAILFILVSVIVISYYFVKDFGVPPGPLGIPILGYWPFLKDETCHLQLLDLKKKYGGVFSFRVTGQLYINLASFKSIREAHMIKADCFSERTLDYNVLGKIFEDGVVFSNGEKWQTVRKFYLQQFRERGITLYKDNTSEAMHDNVYALVDEIRENANKPFDILDLLVRRTTYIIRQTLFGPDTPVTESQVNSWLRDYKIVASLVRPSNLVLIGPLAKYFVLPFISNYKEGMSVHKRVKNLILKSIKDHYTTFNSNHIRDVIDSFILERTSRKLKGDPTAEYFTDETLAANIIQFVGDGSLNAALFISFFIKTLLDHPEEQEKIYKELVEVCGEDRNPTYEDKSKLTYTNAFLLEAQRCINFVPIFPSLVCTKETTVCGYRIPKGAITLTNVYAIHNDREIYRNPEKFDPSRFLIKEAGLKPESPVTFGVGKRVCLGESYVLMQTFLYCVAIVKNFKISYPNAKDYFAIFDTRSLEVRCTPRK